MLELALPPHSKVLSVGHGGTSLWVTAIKITVELKDGTTAEFFKKVMFTGRPLGIRLHQC